MDGKLSTTPRIVDAQIHVWKASTPRRPWPADAIEPQRSVPLEVPEVRAVMTAAGVDAALLLAPTWEGGRNDYVLEAAAAQPELFGALCRFPVADPEAVERLADWRDTAGMRGIRLSLNRGDVDGQLAAATRSGFFRAAERYRVPLSIYAPGRHELYADLAQRYPEALITVDHCAIEDDHLPLVDAITPLLDLARYPGIAVKASALPCFLREEYPFPSIDEALCRLVESFGAERVFFGSDLSRLPVPYVHLVEAFRDHTPGLSDADRRLVLGEALISWLDWPLPAGADRMPHPSPSTMEL
ncbi:amidohydrolase family protein [Gordonia terrae]|uniref:amidohydrolase family protein n=1 Tax=Gordonia terrae TaxID=2055 RepID=UPI003F6AC831